MGSLYQRGRNRIWWIQYHEQGRRVRESSYSTKKSDAKRLLGKREGAIAEGRPSGVQFDRTTFDEVAEYYLKDYENNEKKSIRRAKQLSKNLKRFFAGFRVSQIDTLQIEKYKERRRKKVKPATVNRELSALKRMLNLGITIGKVDRLPHIPMFKEDNVRKGFFEHSEFLALRNALPDYTRGFCTFAYRSGWRRSEIANLEWNQVDRAQGIVTLNPGETKSGAGRTLYLDRELRGVIAKQWKRRKRGNRLTPFVFTNQSGTAKIGEFRKSWQSACKKAEIGEKLFHDLRRTAIRNMVRAGIPERVAMQLSGHKTRSVFDRYNIVSDADLKEAPVKLSAYLEGKIATHSHNLATIGDFRGKKGNSAKSQVVRITRIAPVAQ